MDTAKIIAEITKSMNNVLSHELSDMKLGFDEINDRLALITNILNNNKKATVSKKTTKSADDLTEDKEEVDVKIPNVNVYFTQLYTNDPDFRVEYTPDDLADDLTKLFNDLNETAEKLKINPDNAASKKLETGYSQLSRKIYKELTGNKSYAELLKKFKNLHQSAKSKNEETQKSNNRPEQLEHENTLDEIVQDELKTIEDEIEEAAEEIIEEAEEATEDAEVVEEEEPVVINKPAAKTTAKPAAAKPAAKAAAVKPAAKEAAVKPAAKEAAVKPAAKEAAVKPAAKSAAKEVAAKEVAAKPATVKPAAKEAVAKPAVKEVAKPAAVKPAAKPAAKEAVAKPAVVKKAAK